MASHWACWIIVEWKELYLNLVFFELPRNLYVWSLQRNMIPYCSDLLVRAVRTATTWYSLEQRSSRDLEFLLDIHQDMEWTKYPWGQYSLVQHFVVYNAQDMSNLGVLWLTSWMELWEIHNQIPHEIEMIHDHFMGLEPDPLILHEMVSYQYISLQVSMVPTWLFQMHFLAIFYPRYKLEIPMCGGF